jgi:hypothetical protein
MRKICAKLVRKILSLEQKANRLEICQDLLGRLEIGPEFFLDKESTGGGQADEGLLHHETICQ